MRLLLACTCLTPVALLAAAGPSRAETQVTDARTTPIRTSTIKSGAPDDIVITSTGSVKPTGGTAVTIDSNNKVDNKGTVQITGANGATGILANAGVTSGITNSGTITIDENYTAADSDNDKDDDGPFAQGSNRFGIRTAGAFTGTIVNSGTITVEGNSSSGIALDGALTGSLTHSGTQISVVGDNSYGVRTGDVSGDVKIQGGVSARGREAVAVAITGQVGGSLVIQGGISSTGYRYTTPPADTSKLDADDLLQGGPAVRVSSSVANGIIFAIPPADANKDDADEDDDGIPDANERSAAVVSYGGAPAVVIGGTGDIAIGAVPGTAAGGYGIVVDGGILGDGVYKNVEASGLVVGGQGGAVTLAGGIRVNGAVRADATVAGSTALRIGAEASVPTLKVGGQIAATGGGAASAVVRGIAIDQGGILSSIGNTGTISAAAAGEGTAVAISDKSGTLALIENSGNISATAGTGADKATAIDLSANNGGAIVRQLAVAADKTAPSMTGGIVFGGGNDLLDIADGAVTGTTRFGAGNNVMTLGGDAAYTGNVVFGGGTDAVTLSGTTRMNGAIDFGGGVDSLTLGGTSVFTGTLANSGGAAIAVNGGRLLINGTSTVSAASLALTGGGAIGVNINGETGQFTQYQVSGAASFAPDSKVAVSLTSIGDAEGQYVIVKSGSMTGGANLASEAAALPYLFKSSVAANDAAGEVTLTVARKTSTELGLNRSEAGAYNAIFTALDSDDEVADVFLGIADGDTFKNTVRTMLPDHAGGAFETVTQGSRAAARYLADPDAPMADRGGWGFWLQQVAWGSSKSVGDTSSYDISGWGASGGVEMKTGGFGNLGLSFAYLSGKNGDGENNNEVSADQMELAAHWRINRGGFGAYARISAAQVDFDGVRVFTGNAGSETVSRTARGSWDGKLYSMGGGVSYEVGLGRFSLRPAATVDYYKLTEDGYTETGGGDAFNLIIDGRDSDEFAATGTLTAAYDLGDLDRSNGWFRVEAEGGRRQIVGGELGSTTARFAGGEEFTLNPEQRTNGWVGRLRAIGGSGSFRLAGEAGAEEQQGKTALSFRVSLSLGI